MSGDLLDAIREFAYLNCNVSESPLVSFEHNGMAITNPWIDESARFPLSDAQAVETYGLENIIDFCEQVCELAINR